MSSIPHSPQPLVLFSLIRKDFRFFRTPLVAVMIWGVCCYLLGAISAIPSSALGFAEVFRHRLPLSVFQFCILNLVFCAVAAAALGGMALAGERSGRTALFTAMLPIRRTQIVLSKWIVSVVSLALVLGVHLLIGQVIIAYFMPPTADVRQSMMRPGEGLLWYGWVSVLYAFSFFSIAWLAGSISSSPAISAAIGIGGVIGSALLAMETAWDLTQGRPAVREWIEKYSVLAVALPPLVLAVPSLIIGTVIYLRRVEP